MFYRISTGWGLCQRISPCWAGANSLFVLLRELARKVRICLTVFRGQTGFAEKIDGIPGSTGKTGNLPRRAERVVVRVQPYWRLIAPFPIDDIPERSAL